MRALSPEVPLRLFSTFSPKHFLRRTSSARATRPRPITSRRRRCSASSDWSTRRTRTRCAQLTAGRTAFFLRSEQAGVHDRRGSVLRYPDPAAAGHPARERDRHERAAEPEPAYPDARARMVRVQHLGRAQFERRRYRPRSGTTRATARSRTRRTRRRRRLQTRSSARARINIVGMPTAPNQIEIWTPSPLTQATSLFDDLIFPERLLRVPALRHLHAPVPEIRAPDQPGREGAMGRRAPHRRERERVARARDGARLGPPERAARVTGTGAATATYRAAPMKTSDDR